MNMQSGSQANEAVKQLMAYAPQLVQANAGRFWPTVFIETALAVMAGIVATYLARTALRIAKDDDMDGRVIVCTILGCLIGLTGALFVVDVLDMLTYAAHPEVWAIKDLIHAAAPK